MNSVYHARSCVSKWGGVTDDYIAIHEFIDSSKRIIGDVRHRSLYHHTEGIWLAQTIFGREITTSSGALVPVRLIAERHVEEDLGWIPSPADYIGGMVLKPWMGGKQRKTMPLSTLIGDTK